MAGWSPIPSPRDFRELEAAEDDRVERIIEWGLEQQAENANRLSLATEVEDETIWLLNQLTEEPPNLEGALNSARRLMRAAASLRESLERTAG